MTISSSIAVASLAWTGVESVFAPGFQAQNATDVTVTWTNTGGSGSLTANVHFTATLDGANNWSCVPLAALTTLAIAPATLKFSRNSTRLQALSMQDGSPPMTSVLGSALDLLTLVDQEIRRDVTALQAGGIPTPPPSVPANVAFVSSISALRLISSATYSYAVVTGYYAPGDGGGGLYVYNSGDVTADNGGDVIVGSDGGHWNLSQRDKRDFSLAQFGGKNNDAFSNDTAFANAIARLVTLGGGKLYIPAGIWDFAASANVPNSVSIEIYGDGQCATVLRINTGSVSFPPVLNCGSATQYPTILYLHDFQIYQPKTSTCIGVYALNCNSMLAENVAFVGGNMLHAFSLNACYGVVFRGCYANSIGGACITATVSTLNRLHCEDFLALGCGGGAYFAFDLRGGGQDFALISNDIEGGCGLAILGTCEGLTIEGNYVEAEVSSGPHVYAAGTVNGARVSGNWFGATAGTTNFQFNQMEFSFNASWDSVISFGTAQDVNGLGNFLLTPGTGSLAPFPMTALTLSTPWAVHHRPLQYAKDLSGYVNLGGSFYGGYNGAVIGTLPVGYRPANTRVFACADDNAAGLVQISVVATGVIICSYANAGYACVDGVRFLAEG